MSPVAAFGSFAPAVAQSYLCFFITRPLANAFGYAYHRFPGMNHQLLQFVYVRSDDYRRYHEYRVHFEDWILSLKK